MADIVTSQDIDLSSWYILYKTSDLIADIKREDSVIGGMRLEWIKELRLRWFFIASHEAKEKWEDPD
jgi:hypothetical protein